MSVDTPRYRYVPKRFDGPCECPRCGEGSKTLRKCALPIVMNRFGRNVQLRCDICGYQWLMHTPEAGILETVRTPEEP